MSEETEYQKYSVCGVFIADGERGSYITTANQAHRLNGRTKPDAQMRALQDTGNLRELVATIVMRHGKVVWRDTSSKSWKEAHIEAVV